MTRYLDSCCDLRLQFDACASLNAVFRCAGSSAGGTAAAGGAVDGEAAAEALGNCGKWPGGGCRQCVSSLVFCMLCTDKASFRLQWRNGH